MIREIIKDENILKVVSVEATRKDSKVMKDLCDTLESLKDECIGLAANMIGESKRILCFYDGSHMISMYNPKVVGHSLEYFEVEEGCLSLEGERKVQRFKSITVKYFDKTWKERTAKYQGLSAEVIQHMLDHFEGILI